MSNGVFNYYFFFEEDADRVISAFSPHLKSAGFAYCPSHETEVTCDGFERGFWQVSQENTRILVVKNYRAAGIWKDDLEELSQLEQQSGLDPDLLLGKSTVLLGTGDSWEAMTELAKSIVGRRSGTSIDIKQGALVRYPFSQTRSLFLCRADHYDALTAQFLEQGLALIEADQISLGMVSRLVKDQLSAVLRETEQLDKQLSNMLHFNLVSAHGDEQEAAELENQLKELSASYGKIAGSRALVLKGHKRLQNLLQSFSQLLARSTVLQPDKTHLDAWTGPFRNRMDELEIVEAQLKASQENHQAAIEVVRSRVDIMNSRSNLTTQEQIMELMQLNTEMQKQSLVFQYAAGLIEFIILAYYSHSLWKNLAHDAYTLVPASVQFVMVLLFSGNAVYCTHKLAEYVQGEHEVRNIMILSVVCLLILLVFILVGTYLINMSGTAATVPGSGH